MSLFPSHDQGVRRGWKRLLFFHKTFMRKIKCFFGKHELTHRTGEGLLGKFYIIECRHCKKWIYNWTEYRDTPNFVVRQGPTVIEMVKGWNVT